MPDRQIVGNGPDQWNLSQTIKNGYKSLVNEAKMELYREMADMLENEKRVAALSKTKADRWANRDEIDELSQKTQNQLNQYATRNQSYCKEVVSPSNYTTMYMFTDDGYCDEFKAHIKVQLIDEMAKGSDKTPGIKQIRALRDKLTAQRAEVFHDRASREEHMEHEEWLEEKLNRAKNQKQRDQIKRHERDLELKDPKSPFNLYNTEWNKAADRFERDVNEVLKSKEDIILDRDGLDVVFSLAVVPQEARELAQERQEYRAKHRSLADIDDMTLEEQIAYMDTMRPERDQDITDEFTRTLLASVSSDNRIKKGWNETKPYKEMREAVSAMKKALKDGVMDDKLDKLVSTVKDKAQAYLEHAEKMNLNDKDRQKHVGIALSLKALPDNPSKMGNYPMSKATDKVKDATIFRKDNAQKFISQAKQKQKDMGIEK